MFFKCFSLFIKLRILIAKAILFVAEFKLNKGENYHRYAEREGKNLTFGEKERERQKDRERQRKRERKSERERERETERQRDRETDRQRERETETEIEWRLLEDFGKNKQYIIL